MNQKLKTSSILLILCFYPEFLQCNQNQGIIQIDIIPGVKSNLIQWNFTERAEIDLPFTIVDYAIHVQVAN